MTAWIGSFHQTGHRYSIVSRFLGIECMIGFAPVILITAILLKWHSRGPVFVKRRQREPGGRTVELWEFRLSTEGGYVQDLAMNGDLPLTPLCEALRVTRIATLPRLVNVVAGELPIAALMD